MKKLLVLVLLVCLAIAVTPVLAQEGDSYETGNVIFIHPDGTGLNHWDAARMY